ncbi:MAG: double-strand break repair protein AddB, partial [Rhodospirillaceae bacterium]|nr:double-strand break repair protein AddB [Rhodospirillaceae bacterium]
MPNPKDSRAARPGVYTIPPGASFLETLARGVLDETGGDPLALSDYRILLPTRRAVRALAEAFLRQGDGEAMLLPRLVPIGDVDEDELSFALAEAAPDADALAVPPAIPELRRRLLLAELIVEQSGGRLDADHAIRLAAELARLVDQVQTEGLDFTDLDRLVPTDYAEHWQITLDFLRLVTGRWPARLAEEGAIDPADRRNRLLAAQAARWIAAPPPGPVIAAGSTGSIPATADLLAVVAGMPRGRVVLPCLDRDADDESWRLLAEAAPTHPQHGLARLLARIGIDRNRVADWPGSEPGPAARARARFVAEAMRPAERTDAWRRLAVEDGKSVTPESVAGLRRVVCPTPREEAAVIALLLREVLEEPGRTGALITPDRALARRVAAELRRWGIEIDDSAGQPLGSTPVGAFLRLSARAAAEGFAPVTLLALLKHPLAAAGQAPARLRARVRALERAVLRGPRPAPGLAGLRRAVESLDEKKMAKERADALALVDDLAARAAGFSALLAERRAGLADLIAAHLGFAEALAESDENSGAARLWRGEDGESAAALAAELHRSAGGLPPVAGADYPALFEALIAGPVVRPRWGRHPRLFIWGPLEARLLHADRLILGSLNEGVWPADPPPDPWLSRPMRSRFGLPLPERRIGLSAHDFAQALGARDVVLTRAERVEGAPTVPSRWLLRLETTMRAAGLFATDPAIREAWDGGPWQAWQDRLDRPERIAPCPRPAPRPPLAARPRRLSVTAIGTLMRNPYGVYARHVLDLRP